MAYCEEQVECRRSVLLAHFGESFDPKRGCHGTCDVCTQHGSHTFEQVIDSFTVTCGWPFLVWITGMVTGHLMCAVNLVGFDLHLCQPPGCSMREVAVYEPGKTAAVPCRGM